MEACQRHRRAAAGRRNHPPQDARTRIGGARAPRPGGDSGQRDHEQDEAHKAESSPGVAVFVVGIGKDLSDTMAEPLSC
jgi:hypothetical protein